MEMARSSNDGNLGSAKKELHCVMGLTFTCKYAKSYSIINSIQQPPPGFTVEARQIKRFGMTVDFQLLNVKSDMRFELSTMFKSK